MTFLSVSDSLSMDALNPSAVCVSLDERSDTIWSVLVRCVTSDVMEFDSCLMLDWFSVAIVWAAVAVLLAASAVLLAASAVLLALLAVVAALLAVLLAEFAVLTAAAASVDALPAAVLAELAVELAEFAVSTALAALLDAALAVFTAFAALVDAEFAVETAELALDLAASAVLCAALASPVTVVIADFRSLISDVRLFAVCVRRDERSATFWSVCALALTSAVMLVESCLMLDWFSVAIVWALVASARR